MHINGRSGTENHHGNQTRRRRKVKPVTDEDLKRTLTEFYAAVDDQGREGLFPIAVVFANEDGSQINVFTADHIGNPGELLRDLGTRDWEYNPALDPPPRC
jgi:hypothetical protein